MPPPERDAPFPRDDFYVQSKCCIACGVPQAVAPDLVGWRDAGNLTTCYWIKQPHTPDELERAINVLNAQEVGCHRHAGNDPKILRRLPRQECDYYNPMHPHVRTTRLPPSVHVPNLLPAPATVNFFLRLLRKLFGR